MSSFGIVLLINLLSLSNLNIMFSKLAGLRCITDIMSSDSMDIRHSASSFLPSKTIEPDNKPMTPGANPPTSRMDVFEIFAREMYEAERWKMLGKIQQCSRDSWEICRPYMERVLVVSNNGFQIKREDIPDHPELLAWSFFRTSADALHLIRHTVVPKRIRVVIIAEQTSPEAFRQFTIADLHFENLKTCIVSRQITYTGMDVNTRTMLQHLMRRSRVGHICMDFSKTNLRRDHLHSNSSEEWEVFLKTVPLETYTFHNVCREVVPCAPHIHHHIGFATAKTTALLHVSGNNDIYKGDAAAKSVFDLTSSNIRSRVRQLDRAVREIILPQPRWHIATRAPIQSSSASTSWTVYNEGGNLIAPNGQSGSDAASVVRARASQRYKDWKAKQSSRAILDGSLLFHPSDEAIPACLACGGEPFVL